MSQKQCPNCGGYKLSISTNYVKKVPAPIWLRALGIIFTPICSLYVVLTSPADAISSGVVWVIVIITLIGIAIWGSMKKNEITGHEFTCDLCGYKLDWSIGAPWPKVNVQPNLIAAGAKRLKQQHAAIACKGCGNTIPEGYSYCPYCGGGR